MCADSPARPIRLAIVGGGLGGLTLAQYVQRSTNFHVRVFDRLPEDANAAGYRMRIGRDGILALKESLSPQLFQLFVATSVASNGMPKFLSSTTMELNKEDDPLARMRPQTTAQPQTPTVTAASTSSANNISSSNGGRGGKPEAGAASTGESIPAQVKVNRNTFRELLLSKLAADRVEIHHGLTFTRYEQLPSLAYKVYFHTASPSSFSSSSSSSTSSSEVTFEADVLIGADGVHSSVRSQWLPSFQLSDTGGRLIYSKVSLTPSARLQLPRLSISGSMNAFSRSGNEPFLLTDSMEFRNAEAEAAIKAAGSVKISPLQDYLYVAAVAQTEWWLKSELSANREAATSPIEAKDSSGKEVESQTADNMLMMRGESLLSLLKRGLSHWHPEILSVIALCDPGATAAVKVRTAQPFRLELAPNCCNSWPVVPLLLGDALHPMTPAGQGATIALQDAATLGEQLIKFANGECTLSRAIAAYYEPSIERGMRAVRMSQAGGTTMFGQTPLPAEDQIIVINAQSSDTAL